MEAQPLPVGLSIKTKKTRFRVGEAIFIDVTIKNLSSKKIYIREFLLLPANDPRNNINFAITDGRGNHITRVSHTATGRALVQLWTMVVNLAVKQAYSQRFQLAGMYKSRVNRASLSLKPRWSLGENPEESINDYPVQKAGSYQIIASYKNLDSGSNWPKEYWDREQVVWTGELVSNTISIEVFE
jgi:hypothetical protein